MIKAMQVMPWHNKSNIQRICLSSGARRPKICLFAWCLVCTYARMYGFRRVHDQDELVESFKWTGRRVVGRGTQPKTET